MTYFQLKKYIASSLADVAGEYASYEAEKTVCHLYGIDRRTLVLRQREEAPDKTEETENAKTSEETENADDSDKKE